MPLEHKTNTKTMFVPPVPEFHPTSFPEPIPRAWPSVTYGPVPQELITRKFGTPIEQLRISEPALAERIETHFPNRDLRKLTPGEIQHEDVSYGQADPRIEAGNRSRGDFSALGESGPKKT